MTEQSQNIEELIDGQRTTELRPDDRPTLPETQPKPEPDMVYNNHGETFSEMVQNLANFIASKKSDHLDDCLNLVIGAVPAARARDVEMDGLKAEIIMLEKQRDDYKERAYQLADSRPLIHNLPNLSHLSRQSQDMVNEEKSREAEEERKKQAMAFLGGL